MLSILLIILPVFALVFAGWFVRRIGVFGPQAATELNRFVVYLALPALLFDIVSGAKPAEIWQPEFIGAFGLGCLLVFFLTLAIRRKSGADAAIDALASSYANTGYIGFPLAFALFGKAAMTPTLIASIITVCAIFAVAIVLIEFAKQREKNIGRTILKVATSLVKNPLLVAPLLAGIFPLTGSHLPKEAVSFVKLLGGAASPCALIGLGLFLAEKREAKEENASTVMLLMGMKLILQPAITWMLAVWVFRLPPFLVKSAVVLAALPTGTGPFMLAEYYNRESGVTSKVIMGSTILSVFTISAYLAFSG